MESKAYEHPAFGDLTKIHPEKLQELETILTFILSLPVARETFSQIITGSTRSAPYSGDIKSNNGFDKPTTEDDDATSRDQAMREYEEVRKAFAVQRLKIDLNLAHKYQSAPRGSREHKLRLLEIIAASVNTLAGMVYIKFHEDTVIKPPTPPEGHWWQFRYNHDFYVKLYHPDYKRLDTYPFGLLSVVGYWAEAELFGGVILFEHQESETINAFVHPETTARAFELSDEQLKSFANLGAAGHGAQSVNAETVLPFAKNPDARTELTFGIIGEAPLRIYKNKYDAQPDEAPDMPSCVVREGDELAERAEKAMKFAEESGWIEEARLNARPFDYELYFRTAFSEADEAELSSFMENVSPTGRKGP